jgi:polar amino acid transport system substrate-binding protein
MLPCTRKGIRLFLTFIFLLLWAGQVNCQEISKKTIHFGTINSPQTKIYKQIFALLTEAFKRNGICFSLETLPGKRSLAMVDLGLIDGDAFRVHDLNQFNEYPGIIRVDESILTIDQSVWSKKSIKVDGWESLRPYSIVYQRGTLLIEKHEKIFKTVQVVDDVESIFKILDIDQADITITSKESGESALKKYQLESSGIKLQHPPLKEINLHPYMNKRKHAILALKLAQTIREMKLDGTYARIINEGFEVNP